MPQIDHAELLERIAGILQNARAENTPAPDGTLGPPMPALNRPLRSYAEVYGPETRLLSQLSAQADARGASLTARLFADLETAITEGSLELDPDPISAPRLGRFVYPVV